MLYRKTMAFPRLMPSMATDMLITLMMKFQVIVSASQTRTILILRWLSCLLAEIPQIKIDLVSKISTESHASTNPFLDELSKDLAEDKKQGHNLSPYLYCK